MSAAAVRVGRRTRHFYVGMAIAFAITVFVGFFRSYYFRGWYGAPELSRLVHLHGLVFTTWVLFFVSQTVLVATGRTWLHRRFPSSTSWYSPSWSPRRSIIAAGSRPTSG